MNLTPSIVQHEFIGLAATVARNPNLSMVGITGKVVDETRNTFTILHDNCKKVVAKDVSVFDFVLADGTVVELDGKVMIGRPENRLKKRPRRLW
jgi:ribonuclease P protein subunit POP4